MSLADVYLKTVSRLEPDISMIDAGGFYASAAISLKRIADDLDYLRKVVNLVLLESIKEETSQETITAVQELLKS